MTNMMAGKRVLVTGGCGSVGMALVKRLIEQGAGKVCILDSCENRMFQVQQELSQQGLGDRLRLFLGDVRDKKRVWRSMENVDCVFHCAALKHVALSEYNPMEAARTNVLGAQNVIEAALENNVERVVFTSSDKAVNPTSTMGATKLLAERLFIAANHHAGNRRSRFACVRFGNVANSDGSVIHVFLGQKERGAPYTITSREMTRFLLPMSEAVGLILSAAELMAGGEIFVLKMSSFDIMSLAAALHGAGEPAFVEIGPKPGEKLYEELVTEDEAKRAVILNDMYVIKPATLDMMPERVGGDYARYQGCEPLGRTIRSDEGVIGLEELARLLRTMGVA